MYYEEVRGFAEDGLIGGEHIPLIVENAVVTSAVVRGHLICKGDDGWSPVTENDDASKDLAIVATSFTPDEDHEVTQIYTMGIFNVEKIYIGEDAPYCTLGQLDEVETLIGEEFDLEAFRVALQKQGIRLTSLRGDK